MIYIIDDDVLMAKCITKACRNQPVRIFTNAIEAMAAISGGELPELIFLDILLDGPDGLTFLNELESYSDTSQIPVVIITSLNLKHHDLSAYGVVGVLSKETMQPSEVREYVQQYTH